MGDISEIRGFVVIGTFLTLSILLIGWMPYQFFVASEQQRIVEPPEHFESLDVTRYASTWEYCLNGTDAEQEIIFPYWPLVIGSYYYWTLSRGLGGYVFDIYYSPANVSYEPLLFIDHVDFWGPFKTGAHRMTVYNDGKNLGPALEKTEADDAETSQFIFHCDHTELQVYLSYDTSLYNSPTDALNHNELWMFVGMEWDKTNTSTSAWSIITGMLFFRCPEVNFYVNIMLAIPIWIAVAYLTVIMALRIIGAIFGGGA